eukprot:151486_1
MSTFQILLLQSIIFTYSELINISNINPRLDANGNIMDAHDGNIIQYSKGGEYFYYSMGYGLCQEPSGANASNGCAAIQTNGCGFENNHSINLYTSKNLSVWEFHGNVLPLIQRPNGIYFSPSVVFNPNTNKYILMAHYLPASNGSFADNTYMAAVSDSPYGPFTTMNNNVNLTNPRPGDSKLFVDTDNNGYLIYSSAQLNHSIVVEQLTKDYLYSSGKKSKIFDSKTCLEAPTIFKHIGNGLYYAFTSYCCCYCANGGDVIVWVSDNVLGPYNRTEPFINDVKGVGNNKDLVIHAQETDVLLVETDDSKGYQYIWIGDRWQTAPDGAKAHDFTYWGPLIWNNKTSVQVMKWYDNFTINVKVNN